MMSNGPCSSRRSMRAAISSGVTCMFGEPG
jgi:hypothetical protein